MISQKKFLITIAALVVLGVGAFFGGIKLGARGYVYSGSDFKLINQNDQPHDVDYSLLWQVLNTLNEKYIDKPIDQQKVLYGAVSGAVNALGDPYTTFFTPDQYKNFLTQLSGSFEGIGAEIGMKSGSITIIAPLDNSPAKKAGLQAGDILLKVNGEDATGYTLEQAVDKIRGPKGTSVKLTIYRPKDSKSIDFTITRDTINVTSVDYSIKNINGKKIEVINLKEFGDNSVELFSQAAQQAQQNNVSGIVLDLRDDPGGLLDDAVKIGSFWIDSGKTIVTEAHSDGTNQTYTGLGGNYLKTIPTVVLINGGSASAAEILSGALHDYGIAKLVGEKSFGKGSVQQLIDLPQSSALKVTIAKWLTPKGQNLNHNGLDPDIKVDLTADQVANNQDPQMDAALQLLK